MWTFMLCLVAFFVWIIPLVAIAVSDRTRGGEKAAWLLLVLCVSWFAWVFYLLLAPLKTSRYHRA